MAIFFKEWKYSEIKSKIDSLVMVMTLQSLKELEKWHKKKDPWGYDTNTEDQKRKNVLLSELPQRNYKNVLDVGCGQGFITKDLPGQNVTGVDISENAIKFARRFKKRGLEWKVSSIFDLNKTFKRRFDLIIITGVLYSQYIGYSNTLVYLIIDKLLDDNGVLVSVHHDEYCKSRFPYLLSKQIFYDYRHFTHRLEVYLK